MALGSWNPKSTICPVWARKRPLQAPKTLHVKGKMANFAAKNDSQEEKVDRGGEEDPEAGFTSHLGEPPDVGLTPTPLCRVPPRKATGGPQAMALSSAFPENPS